MMREENGHREAIKSIRGFYLPRIIHGEAAAREYAQLALRSVITLNAGVAVAYPAMAEIFLPNITPETLILPVLFAVCGTVLGIACAYITYFNHGCEAAAAFTMMEGEVLEADEFFDIHTYYRFQQHRAKSKEHWQTYTKRFDNRRELTFYLGNAVGIASLASFVASVVTFTLAT